MSRTGLVRGRWGARRRALRMLVLLTAGLSVLAVAAPGALGSSTLNWSSGVPAPLPSGALTSGDVEMNGVSCASTGNCTVVGRYRDASDNRQGLLLTETNGAWTAVKATLPAGASTPDPAADLFAVSCASAGNCSAVGSYQDSSGTQPVVLTETSGTWSSGVEPSLPSGAATDPQASLESISCTSPGDCTAVGFYNDTSGYRQGVILSETSGDWTATAVSLPTPPTGNPFVYLPSVSCASAGNCAAVGGYTDNSNNQQGLLLTQTSGVWAITTAPVPTDGAASPSVSLGSVSCSPNGDCMAGGSYLDNSGTPGHTQGLLLTHASGGGWTAQKASVPANAGTDPQAYVHNVACPSAGDCSAVGWYYDSSSAWQELLLTESHGTWSAGTEAVMPAGAAANPNVNPTSLSCSSAGNCAAVGTFDNSSGTQGLLLSETNGSWAPGVEARLPSDASANPSTIMGGVSCTSAANCTAVGRYDSTAARPLIFTAGKASSTMSVAAPNTLTVGQTIAGSSVSGTLASGAGPTGAIQFRVFGPQSSPPSSCLTGGHLVGGAVPVSGNRAYHPASGFTPTASGTYWWYARYGGDLSDDAAGSACGASMAKTVVSSAPVVSQFKQTHAQWREGSALARITAAGKPPVGTVFKFKLNQAARVKLVFKHGQKRKGTLSMLAEAGQRSLKFQGRLSGKHRLAPGRYTVSITATNANGVISAARKLTFTIVR